ncbi:MAG: DUF493 domain-containing protein [Gammaproteobacteria bacterium]|nr:DUF493 domain-containing protein [Gammaproteobacteria bacterium]
MSNQELIEFPCAFPIKVMGRDTEDFHSAVTDIVGRHAGDAQDYTVDSRPSREGRFISLTVTLQAKSREHLDKLYRELSQHELVLMVL